MLLHLPGPEDTLALGAALGRALAAMPQPAALVLEGPLGSGKTALVRGLVTALPGAEGAEVSSPSFNIVNHYPTHPPVAHFDLYRVPPCAPGRAPEEYYEALDAGRAILAVEWIERLDAADWPQEALHLAWAPVPSGRALKIRALGKAAGGLLASLTPALNQWEKGSDT